MNIEVDIQRNLFVPAPVAQVHNLLKDYERSIRLFPKLKHVERLGPDAYLWELEPLGAAGVSHVVRYGATYSTDEDGRIIRWQALPGQGNASVSGTWQTVPEAGGTRLTFHTGGTLRDVSVPLVYRPLVPPFVKAQLGSLVDIYLERVASTLRTGLDPRA